MTFAFQGTFATFSIALKWKNLWKVTVLFAGTQVISKAFLKALKQEYAASQQAAARGARTESGAKNAEQTSAFRRTGLTLEEAKQILNIDKLDSAEINKRYEHLYQANDRSKGGSFYVLSKVVRAKERLDQELLQSRKEETKS